MIYDSPDTQAVVERALLEQWIPVAGRPVRATPIDGIGIVAGPGAWPIQPGYDPTKATYTLPVYRNPYDGVWDSAGRFPGVGEWIPRTATAAELRANPFAQLAYDLDASRRPARIPWGPDFRWQDGTTDRGVLVDTKADGSIGWEAQGLTPITNIFDVWAINNRMAWWIADDLSRGELLGVRVDVKSHRPAQIGDLRIDGLGYRSPVTRPTFIGPQGPEPMHDHVLRPEHLSGPWPTYMQLVLLNINYGPTAAAVDGGWVEHREPAAPYGYSFMPAGVAPGKMVTCYRLFKVRITDAAIDQWIRALGVDPKSPLGVSHRCYAVGWRDQGCRVMMTGGWPGVTSTGFMRDGAGWRARGVGTPEILAGLGRRMFEFGQLVAA